MRFGISQAGVLWRPMGKHQGKANMHRSRDRKATGSPETRGHLQRAPVRSDGKISEST
ncbi:hypothetical protein DC3_50080 [Deinococcus cellulosilyticus NBRC 106333 = KACC 11606]|uniref:Uncharacterized protein n=1 Tax=Deinococcus cellulosilyticus (strain DSM 18568 / NBRC 106333 / KACC 11606 / 5516J-15) TaxID=1223518 RepID=A0A511N945_DEIC1|nr:hypothetical protein DC3_50080 [Deinococcus cellulosilyticus NBRC 106333 = KACC 11606]